MKLKETSQITVSQRLISKEKLKREENEEIRRAWDCLPVKASVIASDISTQDAIEDTFNGELEGEDIESNGCHYHSEQIPPGDPGDFIGYSEDEMEIGTCSPFTCLTLEEF